MTARCGDHMRPLLLLTALLMGCGARDAPSSDRHTAYVVLLDNGCKRITPMVVHVQLAKARDEVEVSDQLTGCGIVEWADARDERAEIVLHATAPPLHSKTDLRAVPGPISDEFMDVRAGVVYFVRLPALMPSNKPPATSYGIPSAKACGEPIALHALPKGMRGVIHNACGLTERGR